MFPAGGVATAGHPAGEAEELPWKAFTARLIQQAQAAVLPVYFEGQNSLLFHLVSRYSRTIRLALMVSELQNFVGTTVKVHVGALVPFTDLAWKGDRQWLTLELYSRVHQLAPQARHPPLDQLRPRPPEIRRRYPWDRPPWNAATSAGQPEHLGEIQSVDPQQSNCRKNRLARFRQRFDPLRIRIRDSD